MTGVEDVDPGMEVRRGGETVGVPHPIADGTRLSDLGSSDPQPGDAVTYDGTDIAKATEGDEVFGILVNYGVYGASHQDEQIKGNEPATVAVAGQYKVRVGADVSAGDALGGPDETNATAAAPGELDAASKAASNDAGLAARAVEVSADGDYAEVHF